MSRKLLDPAVKPQVRADVQLLSASEEDVPPEQQDRNPSLDQEEPPDLLHIKEEEEELWARLEGGKRRGPEEADVDTFTFPPDPVRSDGGDREKPQPSQLYHTEEMKTEADGEDCGGPEPDWNGNLGSSSPPSTDYEKSRCSEPETDDSRDWEEASEPQSGPIPVRDDEHPECDGEEHQVQTGTKPFACSVCGKRYLRKKTLTTHLRLHTDWKCFSCSVCLKTFPLRGDVERHTRVHTGEKPFGCRACGRSFSQRPHMKIHKCAGDRNGLT